MTCSDDFGLGKSALLGCAREVGQPVATNRQRQIDAGAPSGSSHQNGVLRRVRATDYWLLLFSSRAAALADFAAESTRMA